MMINNKYSVCNRVTPFCVENDVKRHKLLNMNKTGQTHETDLLRYLTKESVEIERDCRIRKL